VSISEVKLVRPTAEAIRFIADTMREADRVEVMAASGRTPFDALQLSVDRSSFVAVVEADGVPVTILGLVVHDILSGSGVPWLLSSEHALKHKRQFLELSPPVIQEMLTICPKLVNYVHSENRLSIRWLTWLGFTIEEPKPIGAHGEMFHRFSMEA